MERNVFMNISDYMFFFHKIVQLRNPYMGFADFRAAFTPDTSSDWTIDPSEGSLMQREDTNFVVKFRPSTPGMSEGYLVIETEDFKKTWKLVGST